MEYDQEPGTDPDGDDLTYPIKISTPELGVTTPDAALLQVSRDGHNFQITAVADVTPDDFVAVYGELYHRQTPAALYASDGDLVSDPHHDFTIEIYHELSAYFDDADSRTNDQRSIIDDTLETYEGPSAGDNIQIDWSTTYAGTRTWGAGNPAAAVVCRGNKDDDTTLTWTLATA